MATRLDLAHPGLAAAGRMQRLVETWAAGDPLDAMNLSWLMQGLGRYLAGAPDGLKIEDALEVAVPPGASPWWAARQRAERDNAIRRLASTFTGSASARSLAAAEAIRRYEGTAWRHDQTRGAPLTSDPRRQLLFTIFKADADPPTSMRRVYDILCSG